MVPPLAHARGLLWLNRFRAIAVGGHGPGGRMRPLQATLAGLFAFVLLLVCAPAAFAQDAKVLVLHPTPNATIEAGLDALEAAAEDGDFEIEATTDPSAFTAENLANYKAVVFLNVTGDTLNSSQENALQAFIQAGNGFVGIGSSASRPRPASPSSTA